MDYSETEQNGLGKKLQKKGLQLSWRQAIMEKKFRKQKWSINE